MQRDDADPRTPPRPGGTFDALAMALSALVLVAALVFVWQQFHGMEPATLWMWAAMSLLTPTMLHGIGGPPLVLAAGLSAVGVLVVLPVLLWRSAYRSAIVLAFAVTLVGALLVGVASLNPSTPWPGHHRAFGNDSMGFLRASALFDGIALAVWGAVTVLLAAAARRAQRDGSSGERRLRMLAAAPTLLVACVFVVVALVGGVAMTKRASVQRTFMGIANSATAGPSTRGHAALHGHHQGSLPHGDAGLPTTPA